MIIVDYSQLIHNQLYVLKPEFEKKSMEECINFLKHLFFNQLLGICNKYKNEIEVVLCSDYGSWRYDIYPNYKARRKLKRKDDGFDWDSFWSLMTEFENELNENFPFNFIRIKKAEGDDCIGTLVNYTINNKPNEKIIIVSSDKDFKQLHTTPNIIQYDPKNKNEMRGINPKNELMYLILKGDDSDDIVNVRTSNTNTFITEGIRQVTMWRETNIWENINNSTVFENLITTEELTLNFERNRTLIDLSMTPQNIQDGIIQQYNENIKNKKATPMKLLKYLSNKKMKNLIGRMDDFNKLFGIKKHHEESVDDLF
jgi:hypothetical protein